MCVVVFASPARRERVFSAALAWPVLQETYRGWLEDIFLLCCKIRFQRERLALNYMLISKKSSFVMSTLLASVQRSWTPVYSTLFQARHAHLCRRVLTGVRREEGSCEHGRSPTPFSKVEEWTTELCSGSCTLLHCCLDTSVVNLLQP